MKLALDFHQSFFMCCKTLIVVAYMQHFIKNEYLI